MQGVQVEPVTRANRPFQPRGAAIDLLHGRDREILLSGPAGTGKSRACLEKIFLCADKWPGARCMIVRKTRESLTETGLVTWETKVVPEGHPCLVGPQRRFRQSYKFPNGSEVIIAGLDKSAKIMSSEYDQIFIQEATELQETEYEPLTTRLRNGKIPYQQIIADCNPAQPKHWLKQRANSGAVRMLNSRHEDNPELWDIKANQWTARGEQYIAILDALTGPRKLRLRHGIWAQSEGLVYENWNPAVHLVDRFHPPDSWTRYWAVDFGYTNPFVWQEWAMDGDGRLWLHREIYHTKTIVEDHAKRIMELTAGSPYPALVICDHDAGDRATLERHCDVTTVAAMKSIATGLQMVTGRLNIAGDGRPRLMIMRDAVDRRDPALAERSKPCCTAEEWDGYIWRNGRKNEEPVDVDNHGMDATRYMCMAVADDDGQLGEIGSPSDYEQPLNGLPAGTFG